ncbi:MAG TPA: hypothetical protein VK167_02330 [Flavipsychrobacter sp.]|nr:hypothetical protein [Flavipsychrobacter sp.]
MSLKRNLTFAEQKIIHVNTPVLSHLPRVDNIIYKSELEDLKWIEASTTKIGEWRNVFMSTYIRWAISINGLHIAHEKYSAWDGNRQFFVTGLVQKRKGPAELVRLVEWDGQTAATAHIQTVGMLASYGIIDLYSCFEECIFDFYRTYLFHNPGNFIIGKENRKLRRLYSNRIDNPDSWLNAWNERLDSWQRKKMYDGLDSVFLSYMKLSGLEKPSLYQHTTPETWAETLKAIALLRNSLIHGAKTISAELATITQKKHGLSFNFKEGEEINLNTKHLMAIELFAGQILTALNLSLIEKGEKVKALTKKK